MIISHKKKFVFLRTGKTASSSIAIYLSQFCSKKDTISSLGAFASNDEDKFKKKYGLLGSQNSTLKKKSFGIKNFLNFNFYNTVNLYDHKSMDKISKTYLHHIIKDYFFFTFIRNPFEWLISLFYWELVNKKKFKISDINNEPSDITNGAEGLPQAFLPCSQPVINSLYSVTAPFSSVDTATTV